MVQRARLTDRLAEAHHPALTLVSAPAGFGKTTLLAEWFEPPQVPGSSTRRGCRSMPATTTRPCSGPTSSPRCRRPRRDRRDRARTPLQSSATAAVGRGLAGQRPAGLDDDVVLVLDDYHVIDVAGHPRGDRLPRRPCAARLHLVLASRADPPLPLARWRARGELLEIRAADLRFTADEAAAYFNDAMGLHLTADDVDALEARTEGWIAALQLAALSMQGRDDVGRFIENFTGDDRFVVDYLAEEVLDRQPDDVRSFLLQTVDARPAHRRALRRRHRDDRWQGDARAARPGEPVPRPARRSTPLVPLPPPLRRRAAGPACSTRSPSWSTSCTGERATGTTSTANPAEAIAHAMAGHHVDRAAQLIELAAPVMRRTRQEATLRRWLDALPDELFDDRPVLSIALVGARMVTGETAGVEPLLDGVERWLDPATSAGVAADRVRPRAVRPARRRRSRCTAPGSRCSPATPTARSSTRAASLDLAEPTDHLRRGSAAALLGLAHWTAGRPRRGGAAATPTPSTSFVAAGSSATCSAARSRSPTCRSRRAG